MGNTKISVQYKKENNAVTCIIQSSAPGWKIHFVTDAKTGTVQVNNKVLKRGKQLIELSGAKNTLKYNLDKK